MTTIKEMADGGNQQRSETAPSNLFQTVPSLFSGKKRLFIFLAATKAGWTWPAALWRESTQINPTRFKYKPKTD
jgi:hypothetical protein